MAEHKDYGLTGVNQSVQLGKQGPHLKSNGDGTFNVVDSSGSTLTSMNGSNGTIQTHFVTKAQLDSVVAGSNAGVLTLGDSTDSSWTDGAVQTLTTDTSVTDAIDALNEGMENVRNNTFVKSVDTTVDVASGGAPLTSTLTITTVGNANRYTIDWGDGSTDTALTDSTPTHTYTDNTNSPFDVVVTAFNNNGSGEGSSATVTKSDFISLFTGDPAVDFAYFAASSGGSAITDTDAGSAYYLENTTTNIGSATIQYTIDWGDSQADTVITDDTADGGSAGGRLAHTFDTVAETEQSFTTEVTLDSHSTADASVIPTSDTLTIRQYATHTPEVTLDDNSGINENATSGHVVTFTNGTENTIGDYSTYGIRYRYQWGDGSSDTYVNTGSGSSGDTGGTIDHTFTLSSSDQANGVAQDYTGNLSVISNHTSSPFVTSDFTVHVEPDVRATISGSSTTANLKSSNDSSLTVYKGTDLSGTNRAVVTVDNTTQNGDSYEYDFGDGSANVTVTESSNGAGSVAGANITHDYSSASTGSKTLTITASGTPDITAQTDSDSVTVVVEDVPSAPAGLSSQSLSWSTAYDLGGELASGATNNTGTTPPSAGTSLEQTTIRRYGSDISVIQTNTVNNVYDSSTGTLSAKVNGSTDGSKTFTTSTSETGTFSALQITGEGDAHNQISSSTYPENFYQVFDAKVQKNISALATGIHNVQLSHDSTGDTNIVQFVKDNVITVPTLNANGSTDPEYNNGAIIDLTGNGSNFFSREVTVNGVRIVAAGSVGGQTAVPDAFVEKVARMIELFTDVNGSGINETSQRTFIKTLSGDAGTYHANVGPTLQRVARGAGGDYTPNFLTDSGITHYNLSSLLDNHVHNDMVWYLNSDGSSGDGDTDAQEVIEHVFHTLHMHGLDAVSLKMYPAISSDWASGDLYAAMEEAYDDGKWDSSGYGGNSWKTDGDAFEVAAKEYLFLLNFGMFEYSSLWDGGSLSPEWTDDMRTQSGIQTNNPLGYALHNTYIAPVISKPSLTTIRNIFQDGDSGDPTVAGASGYSGLTMSEASAGTYRYISGIPYYNTGSPQVRVSGLTVNNLVGEAYTTSSTILQIDDSTRYESTTDDVIGSPAGYTYAQIDGSTTMLANSVPIAQTGVGTPYTLGDLDFAISSSTGIAIQKVKARARNLDGYGSYTADLPTKIQLHTDEPQGFVEGNVIVDADLGAGFDDDGKRITGFSGTGDTPTIPAATNFYTDNEWTGAVTVAGTSEAIIRLGTLQHYTTDLSTGYLPVGPDLNTGRSGAQYFTFAFRRTTMSNFTVTLTGTISGLFIAAPGTDIDDASTLNGWLDCSSTYGGAGTPGADTSNGGNGSNGCAFTSGDRIVDGTSYNLDEFTFTLGDQNATNSTGNNILVRIKLEDGDSLTALSID